MTTSGHRRAPLHDVVVAARRRLREWLPEGRALPDAVWAHRHRLITRFALAQAVAVAVFGLAMGRGATDSGFEAVVVAIPAGLACVPGASRRLRTMSATVSLMFASAAVVDLAGGVIEAHFHFFIMLGVVALYQDWAAFGVCALITVLHHATFGSLAPDAVFGPGPERNHPLRWAAVHGLAILAASITHLIAWKANEQQELSDPLTRLPNRTAFNERLERALRADGRPVSVLFVDIDDFKQINDAGGHHVGDRALRHAAACMLDAVRAGDLVARVGGDEFAVVVSATAEEAAEIGERVAERLRAPIVVDGREIFVAASIGAADSVRAGSRDPALLLRDADMAMYLAKTSGKDRVVTYTEDVALAVRERSQLVADVGQALSRREFELVYQPAVQCRDGRMYGVEALLRWNNPRRGLVMPDEFIPVAEQTGDIRTIGAWVLCEATRQVGVWRRELAGCEDLEIAVNLSPVQLRDPGLLALVAKALHDSRLPASALTLEVTESMLLADLDLARRQLDGARTLGVKIAIDDFGTGYSSLSYLAQLPADQVKIDRSFVRGLADGDSAVALVKGIIDMAQALHLDVQAEGVDATAQVTILDDLGCPRAQGYLYAKPLSTTGFHAFVTAQLTASSAPAPRSAVLPLSP